MLHVLPPVREVQKRRRRRQRHRRRPWPRSDDKGREGARRCRRRRRHGRCRRRRSRRRGRRRAAGADAGRRGRHDRLGSGLHNLEVPEEEGHQRHVQAPRPGEGAGSDAHAGGPRRHVHGAVAEQLHSPWQGGEVNCASTAAPSAAATAAAASPPPLAERSAAHARATADTIASLDAPAPPRRSSVATRRQSRRRRGARGMRGALASPSRGG